MASVDGRENLLDLHDQVIEQLFGYWITLSSTGIVPQAYLNYARTMGSRVRIW